MPIYTTGTHATGWDSSGLPTSVQEYLATGIAPGHRNNAVYWAACQFHDASFSQAEAEEKLLARGLADGLGENEILRAVASGYNRAAREPARGSAGAPPRKNTGVAAVVAGTADVTSAAASAQVSSSFSPPPMNTSLPSPVADGFRIFIETVFEDKERVAIGRGSWNKEGELSIDYGDVRLRKMWLKNGPPRNLEGVFCRTNPMQYRGAKNNDVTAYRHTLVEFDLDKNGESVPKEIQYAVLLASGFPIRVIVDSGNISLQALVIIDAADKSQYDERVGIVYEYFRKYPFFDDGNQAPSKYCRLPGCERQLYDEKGKPIRVVRQELLAVRVGPANWGEWEKERTTEIKSEEEDLERLTEKRRMYYSNIQEPRPEPMAQAAYHGVMGDIAQIVTAKSEACPESILVQSLVSFGNLIGRKPYIHQASWHHLNEFVVLAGETATGCKGISWDAVSQLTQTLDPSWFDDRVMGGFNSGEGIIDEVRDASTKAGRGGKAVTDPGVSDKRLLIFEDEFGRLLTAANWQNSTLSAVLRDIWDGRRKLRSISIQNSRRATGAHISLIGHITPRELRAKLTDIDSVNGFANRILWIAVEGNGTVAIPPLIDWQKEQFQIVNKLRNILADFASRPVTRLEWTAEGELAWNKYYQEMKSRNFFGLLAPIIKRSIPHVLRLTGIYTVLDNAIGMRPEHLAAARAVVDYDERSAQWIFQQKTGDKEADRILWALEREPRGISRNAIGREVFGGNRPAAEIDMKLTLLRDNNKADFRHERSAQTNRITERWYAQRYLPETSLKR
jgi:hypothetical protein